MWLHNNVGDIVNVTGSLTTDHSAQSAIATVKSELVCDRTCENQALRANAICSVQACNQGSY